MPNSNAARGLILTGSLIGIKPRINKYFFPTSVVTARFIGDPVKVGSSADTSGKYASVDLAAAGDLLLGVIVGFVPVYGTPSVNYSAASTAAYVYVCDDPNAIYDVQEDSVGGALTIAEVGENADIIVAAGSTTTGYSGVMLDSSDHKTATAQLRILKVQPKDDNALGSTSKIQVMINEHSFKSTTGA